MYEEQERSLATDLGPELVQSVDAHQPRHSPPPMLLAASWGGGGGGGVGDDVFGCILSFACSRRISSLGMLVPPPLLLGRGVDDAFS